MLSTAVERIIFVQGSGTMEQRLFDEDAREDGRTAASGEARVTPSGSSSVHRLRARIEGMDGTELSELEDLLGNGRPRGSAESMGRQLELELAETFGTRYARTFSSGTGAMHSVLAALEIEPGEEVVLSPLTHLRAISAILLQGATPVFADVEPDTGNLTVETIRPRLTHRTRAVILGHLFGNPADVGPVRDLADTRGFYLVEDASEAYLASYGGSCVGTLGHAGVFSLGHGCHMTCDEGGFLLTDSRRIARQARQFADGTRIPTGVRRAPAVVGVNYRMSEFQAAVARAQLRKLDDMVARRIELAELLRHRLEDLRGVRALPQTEGARATYGRFALDVGEEADTGLLERVEGELHEFDASRLSAALLQPDFLSRQLEDPMGIGFGTGRDPARRPARIDRFPGCDTVLERVVAIPWTHRYEPRDVGFIAGRIRKAVEEPGGAATAGATAAAG